MSSRCARGGAAGHRPRALSRPASVPRPSARRQAQQGPGAGLGAQPLRLSGGDPAQGRFPDRDAARIANLRREWLHRITDHDGVGDEQGGIDRWLILTDGLGLDRDYVISQEGALPATKFAVEAYVRFVREKPLVEAVASSLTELFAPVDPQAPHRRDAGQLQLHRREGGRLFPPPARPGAEGRPVCARLRQKPTPARSKSSAAPLRL